MISIPAWICRIVRPSITAICSTLLVEPKDETKALAIYNRFLRNSLSPQPPERIARYAFLQQKQNHPEEASSNTRKRRKC